MRRIILILILIMLPFAYSTEGEKKEVFFIQILNSNNQYELEKLFVSEGFETENEINGQYSLISKNNNEVIKEISFDIIPPDMNADPNWFDSHGHQISTNRRNNFEYTILLKSEYIKNIDTISFFDNKREIEILNINVREDIDKTYKEPLEKKPSLLDNFMTYVYALILIGITLGVYYFIQRRESK